MNSWMKQTETSLMDNLCQMMRTRNTTLLILLDFSETFSAMNKGMEIETIPPGQTLEVTWEGSILHCSQSYLEDNFQKVVLRGFLLGTHKVFPRAFQHLSKTAG